MDATAVRLARKTQAARREARTDPMTVALICPMRPAADSMAQYRKAERTAPEAAGAAEQTPVAPTTATEESP